MKRQIKAIFFLFSLFLVFVSIIFAENFKWFVAYFATLPYTIIFILTTIVSTSAIFVVCIIFLENKNPSKTLAWLLVLSSFPIVGFPFYILLEKISKRKKSVYVHNISMLEASVTTDPTRSEKTLLWEDVDKPLVFRFVERMMSETLSDNTNVRISFENDGWFEEVTRELSQAQKCILLECYSFNNGRVQTVLLDIFTERIKNGVEIKFLCDGVGGRNISSEFINKLRTIGVEVAFFSRVRFPSLNNRFYFRNVRNVINIDGDISYIGSVEEISTITAKDLDESVYLRVEGESGIQLYKMFLYDWQKATNEVLSMHFRPHTKVKSDKVNGVIQLIADGPNVQEDTVKNIIFSMIAGAKHSIKMIVPYFVPNEDVFSALKIAALNGVEVTLIIPESMNRKLEYYASASYFQELLDCGVQIFERKGSNLNAKIIIVDDAIASVGATMNQTRTELTSFDIKIFLYQTPSIRDLVHYVEQHMVYSSMICVKDFKKRSFLKKMSESFAKLLSPLF